MVAFACNKFYTEPYLTSLIYEHSGSFYYWEQNVFKKRGFETIKYILEKQENWFLVIHKPLIKLFSTVRSKGSNTVWI